MANLRLLFIFASLIFQSFGIAQPLPPLDESLLAKLTLKEVDIGSIVTELRSICLVPICFEEVSYTRVADALYSDDAVKELEAIQRIRPLTRDESVKFQTYKAELRDGKRKEIGIKKKRISIDVSSIATKGLSSLLNDIVEKDNRYIWKQDNTRIIILPKNSRLAWSSTLILRERTTLGNAFTKMKDEFHKHNLGMADIVTGPGVPSSSEIEIGPLSLSNEPAWIILTRITESASSLAYWTVSGYKDMSFFSIGGLPQEHVVK